MDKELPNNRLPRNFHRTFIPERHYINAMLSFSASNKSGDYQEIASETGIPMGKSSGKVPAILDYCRGMGLISLNNNLRSAKKEPQLTPFGRSVYLEDPYLKEKVTQWIAHFNLCRISNGADLWFHIFCNGRQTLGMSFTRAELEKYLSVTYNSNTNRLIGPIIRMYEENAAFKNCGVLSNKSGIISREPAPVSEEFVFAYGAWLLQLISNHFPLTNQITISDLESRTGFKSISGWNSDNQKQVLKLIENKGLITIDRQMQPWAIQAKADVVETWNKIYDDLI